MNQARDESDYWYGNRSYRSVLYPDDRELRVKLNGMKPSYLPGAEVNAGLRVSDATGAPINGAVGITVFDSAVAQRADTEDEESDRRFGARWWLDEGQAGGVTRADLDKVDASKEIPDELELAAEAMLLNSSPNMIRIEGTSDDEIRREYQSMMTKDLEPLGKAIVAVSYPHLPRTSEAVQRVARAANLDAALLDPWNTPYKVETQTQASDEVVTFTSAGPDKRFGTDDDIPVGVAKRNLFAVPGAKLNRILIHAAESGQSLPGTPEQLNALAAAGGLDLDSAAAGTLTPAGKPYTYGFVVQRRFYYLVAIREDKTTVWTSAAIDYFSPTEARIAMAALHAWQAAGHAFPATEDEARQVFAAAEIDLKSLHDPLGTNLVIRATQLMAYTHLEQVKAGDHLQVKTKPVTQLMRAIQIVRSPNASLGETIDTADLVAQFLHPVSEQSGDDLAPRAFDQGTFKGNTGAIGGSVTDQTGAVIPHAIVTVKSASGVESQATSLENGMYIVSDLAPGVYSVSVQSPGFRAFEVHEVHVSAVALTTVDVTLSVGTASETVTVEAQASPMMATDSGEVVSARRAFVGPDKRTIVTGPGGGAEISEPTFTPRLRHVFDETAYWAPSLETGAGGRANLSFHLPDSLTSWRLHALASTSDGRVGVLEDTFKTFQPFFIDLDSPQVLTAGDEVTLPVNLRNYTAQALTLPVTVKAADWFQPLTPLSQRITVPAGNSAKFNFGFRSSQTVDEGPLQMTAANRVQGDAVEKKIHVHPDGKPETVHTSGLLRGASSTLDIDLPANMIPGSLHAQILLYPNLGAQLVHSIEAVLELPLWMRRANNFSARIPACCSWNCSRLRRSVLRLKRRPRSICNLATTGFRTTSQQVEEITYWGGHDDDPDPALTAYGVGVSD